MTNIFIIGLGAMGASLARVLSKNHSFQVEGWDIEPSHCAICLENGWISSIRSLHADLTGFELIIIATPVLTIPQIFSRIAGKVNEEAIVTDIGSTKNSIIKEAKKYKFKNFIGGHPMCGFELSGPQQSDPKVFKNAAWVLCRKPSLSQAVVSRLVFLLSSTEAVFFETSAQKHDEAVAVVSHLPQIVATALSSYSLYRDSENALVLDLGASGFRDVTRLASSGFHLWGDIFSSNKNQILLSITGFQKYLASFKKALRTGNANTMKAIFQAGNDGRAMFKKRQESRFKKSSNRPQFGGEN